MKRAAIISNNFYILKSIFKISPSRFMVNFVNILVGLFQLLFVNIYLIKLIFDSIVNLSPFDTITRYLIILGISYVLIYSFNYWFSNVYIPRSNMIIRRAFQKKLLEKAKSIDLSCYDAPEFYDKYIWVMNDADNRAIKVMNTCFSFVKIVFTITGIFSLAVALEPMIIAFCLVYTCLSLYLNKQYVKVSYDYEKNSITMKRQIDYLKRTFYLPEYAKEIRLFNISNVLMGLYDKVITQYSKIINVFGRKVTLLKSGTYASELLFGRFLPFLYIALKAIIYKTYTVGTLSALVNIILSLKSNIQGIIDIIPQLHQHSMYIENYKKFISMEPKIRENHEGLEPLKGANGIELRNVSFRYDKNSDYILKNINMKIKPGEKIAIVGHNGAGKTTLIKLIMRLYLPDEGEIILDGREAGEYKLSSYRNRFGIVFQDFQLYAASVSENVIMDECTYSEEECDKVNKALKSSGMYERIYNGNDNDNSPLRTSITKEFDKDGFVFSGGQAQKIAIARVFARDCGVVVLDEPSSALDPISEYEMHKNMLEAARNKTVILISHRLSTTKDADRIYYLENGMILEEGSHDELMSLGGKYAQMFNLQAEKYKRSSVTYA